MFLPTPPGRYAVGATTFSRFYPSVAIGTTKLRHSKPDSDTAPPEHALQLEEIAFTAFYPTDPSSRNVKPGLNWITRCVSSRLPRHRDTHVRQTAQEIRGRIC
jgi:platelet-activating factor acetylhydrolase